jgi:hypothetical protein
MSRPFLAVNQVYKAAKDLLSNYINVIPCGRNKAPALPAALPYFNRAADPTELAEWFSGDAYKGLGIICGSISRQGLWCIDCDNQEAVATMEALIKAGSIPDTVRVTQTRRGRHYWYHSPICSETHNPKLRGPMGFFDIRSNNCYAVAPPSLVDYEIRHEADSTIKGLFQYTWHKAGPWDEIPLFDPQNFIALIPVDKPLRLVTTENTPHERPERPDDFDFFDPALEGSRNSSLTSAVGFLINNGVTIPGLVLDVAKLLNKTYKPPLELKEVERVVESVFSTHARNHPEKKRISIAR